MGHLLQSCENWLRFAATQAQGIAVEYREDADVRAVLGVEGVVGEQASPMNALAHVVEMFRPSASWHLGIATRAPSVVLAVSLDPFKHQVSSTPWLMFGVVPVNGVADLTQVTGWVRL